MVNVLCYLAVTCLSCFGIHWFWFQRKRRNWERTSLVALSVSLTAVLVLSWCGAYQENNTGWDWVFTGIKVVFQVFQGDSGEFRTYAAFLPAVPEVLSCAVPVLTVSAALSLLWSYLPHHVPLFKKVWHIFSGLDANSVRMARDLASPDSVCIFLRTRRDKADRALLKELREITYHLYPRSGARFLRLFRRRRKILRFYFLSENTDENFERMNGFLEAVAKRDLFIPTANPADGAQQELYLLSETESAPMLIDHLRSKLSGPDGLLNVFRHTQLYLLDRFRATSYDLLREVPLHRHIHKGKLNILVLGFGKIGREFVRTACSLSILQGCKTEFTLCDTQIEDKFSRFLAQCPELEKSVALKREPLDAETDDLKTHLAGRDYHYILVALGDDERNIRVASRLKRFYRRRHWEHLAKPASSDIQPQICVNIEDSIKHEYTMDLWDSDRDWDHALHVFGGLDQVFTRKVLIPRDLWTAARYAHEQLEGKNWGEYERRSSIACAVRAEYLCDTVCGNAKRAEYENKLDPARESSLADTEHLRWMAYVRSEGMEYAPKELVKAYYEEIGRYHVDSLGKLTPCLIEDRDQLQELWKHLAQDNYPSDYSGRLTFRQRDERLVTLSGEIARIADPDK